MSTLTRHLLTRPVESLDLVLSYLPRLEWASSVTIENRLLWSLLKFRETHNRLPDASAVRFFLENSTDKPIVRRREQALQQLAEDMEDESEIVSDLEMLINACIDEARVMWFTVSASTAVRIAENNLGNDDDKIRNEFGTGPDAAAAYFREQVLQDGGTSAKKDLEGDIHQNLPNISLGLDQALDSPHSGRLFTGFRSIDDAIQVGPEAKYIGIVGTVNGGKSTFTRSLLYNFAAQGANVLYIPREQSCRSASEQFIWLHADAIGRGRELPSLHEWRANPERVTDRQRQAKDEVFADFASRVSIPGSIDVVRAASMADVLSHYEAHKRRKAYSVICIDYLAHLEVPTKDDRQGHMKDFATFQSLSQNENIVCVTPLQSNREGFRAADEAEGDDWGVFQSTSAIEYYSTATQGMDLVMGVWYRGFLKEQNRMRIAPIKVREGMWPQRADVIVDPVTRRVRDSGAVYIDDMRDLTYGGRYADLGDNKDPELTGLFEEEFSI